MEITILFVSVIILLCVLAEKFSGKFGMPALILFMFIGMLFGSDGIFKIPFDNFKLAENICTVALLFIMFYGGFNTKWELAKCVAAKSIILSTAGVVITAAISTLLCHLFLGLTLAESFLISAVLASTDAASVFSILRTKNLNLKDGTASLLELESGSNDPMAYLLTIIGISVMGKGTDENIFVNVMLQIIFGVLIGVVAAKLTIFIISKTPLISDGLETIFMIALVLLCYALTALTKGNVLLSVYIMGILIGNSNIKGKNTLIPFFDGVTSLSQILIFFLLGLLTFPHLMPNVFLIALVIVIILTLIARPIAVFTILLPLKCSIRQCLLVSWAGLRGAASSVFAIVVIASGVDMQHDLFHIVFLVSLFSVAVQGTLLPAVAKKLDMIDDSIDVRKTFNDYQEESSITLMRMYIPEGHNWANRAVKDVNMPTGSLALMIKRDGETIITKGDTVIKAGDNVILSVPAYNANENETLEEVLINHSHTWKDKCISELNLPSNELIAMIIRGSENIIPDGKTVIHENDIVVEYHTEA